MHTPIEIKMNQKDNDNYWYDRRYRDYRYDRDDYDYDDPYYREARYKDINTTIVNTATGTMITTITTMIKHAACIS